MTVLHAAAKRGYDRMRLDTIVSMTGARTIYEALGFDETAPYYNNSLEGVVYYERALGDLTTS